MMMRTRGVSSRQLLTLVSMPLLTAILLLSCKGAAITSGKSSSTDISLSFKVLKLPASASAYVSPSVAISPLIMPTSTTLTVTMTPVDAGLSVPDPQVVPIPSSGTDAGISVSFSSVEYGSYAITAVATNSSGIPESEGHATASIAKETESLSLVLMPVGFAITTVASMPYFVSFSAMAPDETQMILIPPGLLSTGPSIPAGYYEFSGFMAMYGSCTILAVDADGNTLFMGELSSSAIIPYPGIGTSIVNSVTSVYIGPCPATAPSYLIFINSSATNMVEGYLRNMPS